MTTQQEERDTRVILAGELDAESRDSLAACLESLTGRGRVVLDLTDLTFMDSGGLGLILRAQQRFDDELRELIVTNPAANVRRLLEMTDCDHLIRAT